MGTGYKRTGQTIKSNLGRTPKAETKWEEPANFGFRSSPKFLNISEIFEDQFFGFAILNIQPPLPNKLYTNTQS